MFLISTFDLSNSVFSSYLLQKLSHYVRCRLCHASQDLSHAGHTVGLEYSMKELNGMVADLISVRQLPRHHHHPHHSLVSSTSRCSITPLTLLHGMQSPSPTDRYNAILRRHYAPRENGKTGTNLLSYPYLTGG